MKLYEFFGHFNPTQDQNKTEDPYSLSHEDEELLSDQVFWYILDSDELHKKYFMPVANKLKKIYDSESKTDDLHDWKVWIPMVNKGCVEYFEKHDIKGNPREVFNKKFRKTICVKLTDHYHDDIVKGEYQLGQ